LGGVLLIDVSSYVVSFLCYFAVRKGRHVVPRPSELRADIVAAETAFGRFLREMHEGIQFVRGNRPLILLGISWALVLGAMVSARRPFASSMGALAICVSLAPLSPVLAIAVAVYGIMGSARGVSGIAINTSLMELVPRHFMGRVQNTFYFAGTGLQIVLGFLVGAVAQLNLVAGFCIIGLVYAVAFVAASWPVATPVEAREASPVE